MVQACTTSTHLPTVQFQLGTFVVSRFLSLHLQQSKINTTVPKSCDINKWNSKPVNCLNHTLNHQYENAHLYGIKWHYIVYNWGMKTCWEIWGFLCGCGCYVDTKNKLQQKFHFLFTYCESCCVNHNTGITSKEEQSKSRKMCLDKSEPYEPNCRVLLGTQDAKSSDTWWSFRCYFRLTSSHTMISCLFYSQSYSCMLCLHW